MRTLSDHKQDADLALKRYTDPTGRFAFRTYDRQPPNQGNRLQPEDILAANLLSLRLGARDVIPLFADSDGHPQHLLAALNAALVRLRSAAPFESYSSETELDDALQPLADANEATRHVRQWTPVTVSKVLHRHAPHVVPIVDSRVRAFYDTTAGHERELRHRLWRDITKNQDWLDELRLRYPRSDGQPMSILRAADILIWSADEAKAAD